ncbi:hypothetical protein [Pendulispora albinea]|uniref:Bulb-type lectin domain-containing protein n=1 Tax=Pendulispora albinea TaxID=2741071 RepID=A0ABZ2M932_9BACT
MFAGDVLDFTYSNPPTSDPLHFEFQADGNAVLYEGSGHTRPYWASGTWGPNRQNWHLALQTDGNVVIYDGTTIRDGHPTPGAVTTFGTRSWYSSSTGTSSSIPRTTMATETRCGTPGATRMDATEYVPF